MGRGLSSVPPVPHLPIHYCSNITGLQNRRRGELNETRDYILIQVYNNTRGVLFAVDPRLPLHNSGRQPYAFNVITTLCVKSFRTFVTGA